MPVAYTQRFDIERAFLAYTRTGEPTDETPTLHIAEARYRSGTKRTVYFLRRTGGKVLGVASWTDAINFLDADPASFADAAREWARARAQR